MENNQPEDSENDGLNSSFVDQQPQRHGCVTSWLIFMLVINAIVSMSYFIRAGLLAQTLNTSINLIYLMALIGVLNVVFTTMMLQWKKAGFYGFAGLGVLTFIINITIGLPILSSVFGFVGFVVLYAIFQIKKDGVTAWDYLK